MATYRNSLIISTDEAALVRHYLDDEPKNEDEMLLADNSFIYGVRFFNGYEMELHCNGIDIFEDDDLGIANTAWGEAILFDEQGNETDDDICEGSGEFFSTWSLEGGDGNIYEVNIIANKEE